MIEKICGRKKRRQGKKWLWGEVLETKRGGNWEVEFKKGLRIKRRGHTGSCLHQQLAITRQSSTLRTAWELTKQRNCEKNSIKNWINKRASACGKGASCFEGFGRYEILRFTCEIHSGGALDSLFEFCVRVKVMKEAMSVALALRNGRLSDLLRGNCKKSICRLHGPSFRWKALLSA